MNIRLSILIIFHFSSLVGMGQVTVISGGTDRYVFTGIPNTITVVNSSIPCDSIAVITSTGTLVKYRPCEYIWNPEKTGVASITAMNIAGVDSVTLGEKKYTVSEMGFKLKVYDLSSDTLSLHTLLHLDGPMIVPDIMGHINMIELPLRRYTVIGMRGDRIVFNITNGGKQFSGELKNLFKLLKPNDTLIFCQIECLNFNGNLRKIASVEYVIMK